MLVLGATGLLGQAFVAEGHNRNFAVRTAARKGADIALDISDPVALAAILGNERPNVVVNCAALVDVAKCDRDPGLAYRINAAPLLALAGWCRETDAKLVHISTDHFFVGQTAVAHDEDTPVSLLNQYAATKYAAEHFAAVSPQALILRTSIVGIRRWETPSFAEWAIAAILADSEMTLFADAFTSSIDVGTFARAALVLADEGAAGLINLAASEVYSKEAFIRQIAAEMGKTLTNATVGSVGSLTPPRPKSLGLDVARAEALLGKSLPNLEEVVRAIVSAYRSAS